MIKAGLLIFIVGIALGALTGNIALSWGCFISIFLGIVLVSDYIIGRFMK